MFPDRKKNYDKSIKQIKERKCSMSDMLKELIEEAKDSIECLKKKHHI